MSASPIHALPTIAGIVELDLTQTPEQKRRAAVYYLGGLPLGTRVLLRVGDIEPWHPDLVRFLAEAAVSQSLYVEILGDRYVADWVTFTRDEVARQIAQEPPRTRVEIRPAGPRRPRKPGGGDAS